ncbi:helix-turn-helix transcriptional regulator [Saccharopolyspora sp. 6M]|uniref:helix-turn-helix domain-containing protein n=1 Tax=Saccharopolyspora sp. 6M TaxID=2877237 RepID=UPI001CD48407|nr:helix-turn-helix transcriptional regulator [Saccharopolyspora sp. 6M]MCA1229979.1 helix-turn-helix transcriptional regulator [Saccharopolyspora sp. 6M]
MTSNARTPKARALGNALRQAREAQGLSLRALAKELDKDPGVVSRWENGERTPKATDVAQILTLLGVNGSRYDEIVELTTDTTAKQWLAVTLPELRQQLTALLDLEKSASAITEVTPNLIPGLLQTSDYVRAIMSSGGVPEDEIETRVAVRLGRADAIRRSKPARYLALVGEAALRQVIGPRDSMIYQLRYLREASEMPHVDVRVLTYTSGWQPALEGHFLFIESEQLGPVVHLENRRSGIFFHEGPDVESYGHAIDMVIEHALDAQESVELISRIINELENDDG